MLIHGSIASHQRNVFLRNDGHGGFDEISGALGLDLDQDGRSFAVLDIDRDGDPDLVVMAARQAPQLRVFRNDFETTSASLAVRLVGTKSNRDAVGARVTVQTDRMTKTKSRDSRIGISVAAVEGTADRSWSESAHRKVDGRVAVWRHADVFADVPLELAVRIVEGGRREDRAPGSPFGGGTVIVCASLAGARQTQPGCTSRSLRRISHFRTSPAQTRSLAALKGKPAVVLLWSPDVAAARTALETLGRGATALAQAGVGSIAIAHRCVGDQAATRSLPRVRCRSSLRPPTSA